MSDGVVREWCRKFKEGRTDIHDEEGQGHKSVAREDNVQRVNQVVRKKLRFTIGELCGEFPEVSRSFVYTIVTEHLHYKKTAPDGFQRCCLKTTKVAKWHQRWMHSNSPNKPKKLKQTFNNRKVMATVFWDRKVVLLVKFMKLGTTINAAVFCQNFTTTAKSHSKQKKRHADFWSSFDSWQRSPSQWWCNPTASSAISMCLNTQHTAPT